MGICRYVGTQVYVDIHTGNSQDAWPLGNVYFPGHRSEVCVVEIPVSLPILISPPLFVTFETTLGTCLNVTSPLISLVGLSYFLDPTVEIKY